MNEKEQTIFFQSVAFTLAEVSFHVAHEGDFFDKRTDQSDVLRKR